MAASIKVYIYRELEVHMHGKAVMYTGAPGRRVKAHDQFIILDSKQSTSKIFYKPALVRHAILYMHDTPQSFVYYTVQVRWWRCGWKM